MNGRKKSLKFCLFIIRYRFSYYFKICMKFLNKTNDQTGCLLKIKKTSLVLGQREYSIHTVVHDRWWPNIYVM
jgi:hypothetical protein